MPYTAAGKNLMLNALRGTNPTTPITHMSLHTAAPGESGASEVTGGSPAYARKAVTLNAPSAGSMAIGGTLPVFDVPAATTITHAGFWSAVTAGTFLGWVDVTDEAFASQGTYSVTSGALDLNL